MKKFVLILLILSLSLTLMLRKAAGQKVEYIKIPELEKILNNPENKLFVVNLWATWCGPCVSELPLFQKIAPDYDTSKVRFILISLDFPSQVESHLIPFLKNNRISLETVLMSDLDYDSWIEKVDPSWQGNIPATLLFNNYNKARHFHSGVINEPDLRKLISRYL